MQDGVESNGNSIGPEAGGSLTPAETTAVMQRGRPFQPGQSGNPLGRRKGSRNKLTEQFLNTIVDDFTEHGAEAIAKVRTDDPAMYLKIVGSLVPRQLIMQREERSAVDYAELTNEELVEIIAKRRKQKAIEELLISIG
jgi:hypothetical protein